MVVDIVYEGKETRSGIPGE